MFSNVVLLLLSPSIAGLRKEQQQHGALPPIIKHAYEL